MLFVFFPRSLWHSGESGEGVMWPLVLKYTSLGFSVWILLAFKLWPQTCLLSSYCDMSKQYSNLHAFWWLNIATHIKRVNSSIWSLQNIKKPCILSAFLLSFLMSHWLYFCLRPDHFSRIVIISFFLFTFRVLEKEVTNYAVLMLGEW